MMYALQGCLQAIGYYYGGQAVTMSMVRACDDLGLGTGRDEADAFVYFAALQQPIQ